MSEGKCKVKIGRLNLLEIRAQKRRTTKPSIGFYDVSGLNLEIFSLDYVSADILYR